MGVASYFIQYGQSIIIAPDKREYPDNIFSYFSTKTYVVGTH